MPAGDKAKALASLLRVLTVNAADDDPGFPILMWAPQNVRDRYPDIEKIEFRSIVQRALGVTFTREDLRTVGNGQGASVENHIDAWPPESRKQQVMVLTGWAPRDANALDASVVLPHVAELLPEGDAGAGAEALLRELQSASVAVLPADCPERRKENAWRAFAEPGREPAGRPDGRSSSAVAGQGQQSGSSGASAAIAPPASKRPRAAGEEPAATRAKGAGDGTLGARLLSFYMIVAPNKPEMVGPYSISAIVKHYREDEDKLNAKLLQRYGVCLESSEADMAKAGDLAREQRQEALAALRLTCTPRMLEMDVSAAYFALEAAASVGVVQDDTGPSREQIEEARAAQGRRNAAQATQAAATPAALQGVAPGADAAAKQPPLRVSPAGNFTPGTFPTPRLLSPRLDEEQKLKSDIIALNGKLRNMKEQLQFERGRHDEELKQVKRSRAIRHAEASLLQKRVDHWRQRAERAERATVDLEPADVLAWQRDAATTAQGDFAAASGSGGEAAVGGGADTARLQAEINALRHEIAAMRPELRALREQVLVSSKALEDAATLHRRHRALAEARTPARASAFGQLAGMLSSFASLELATNAVRGAAGGK